MDAFEYTANPTKVVFGSGALAKLPAILASLQLSRPLLLSTPQQIDQAEQVRTLLGGAVAGLFSEATMHTPVDVTERAVAFAQSSGADSLVSLGGGSTIGLGKAISVRTGLHNIAIPTTYAGSEVTPILGETADGLKTTRSDPAILPGTVVYDVDLTMTLPAGLSATSGVNAIAHAVEALYAQNANPIIAMFAQEGLCHAIGGSFNLPHAETHTIVLPHALAYNAPAIPVAMAKLAEALPGSEGDAVRGLNTLLDKLQVKRGLRDLGMKEEDIDKAADIAVSKPYWNPRPVERMP
ncbi:unnamed protein product [Parascedosporium putredinis]|uniref:Alcohol dehydrogenase iron-type/glycerol dehydrogenase GldA domain-containing protein n=1 Tax=Parascedosporium putredinis TaxID=1442378 RepID=A0A9P1H0H6_9PEZI|nr:unnamed protein product [Parascedosporium putredinis]CAI7992151.1 unnamed protein product [Parascedosporium putredinis]